MWKTTKVRKSNLHLASFKRREENIWRTDGCDFFKTKKDINFQIQQIPSRIIKTKFTFKYSESAIHRSQITGVWEGGEKGETNRKQSSW